LIGWNNIPGQRSPKYGTAYVKVGEKEHKRGQYILLLSKIEKIGGGIDFEQ
jgi:hypothetical protein